MTVRSRSRRAVACAAALLACLLATLAPATSAHAHEVDRDVRFVVESIEPELEGIDLVVVRGIAPQVVVDNGTDAVLEVLDETGRPFLRIGPDGVEADQAAYAWVDTADPAGIPPGVEVPRDLPPEWSAVREEPSWGWFDHRLHAQPLRFDEAAGATEVLDRWELDLRLDGEPVTLRGRTERRPVLGATLAAITSGNQPLDGVSAQILPGELPGISMTASVPVTVLGADGEPFLRFGPDGVEANLRSPTWVLSGRAASEGTDPSELDVDASAPPRWSTVSAGASFGWLDPRLTAPEELPAGTEVDADLGYATLGAWEVPLVPDAGEPVVLSGETRYAPLPDPPAADRGRTWALAAVAAAVALLAVGYGLRRRGGR